jgi:AcrR family transcriptional regulator
MTRISKPPHERKKEIMDAALELFLTRGYAKTSVSDIVQKVNVAQGLFYYYFKSKEEVFLAAMEQYTQQFSEKMTAIITDHNQPLLKRIELIFTTLHNLASQTEGLLMEGMTMADQMDLDLRLSLNATQALIKPVSEVLDKLNERGATRIEDTMATASFLVFGILGLIHGNAEALHDIHYLKLETVVPLLAGVLHVTPEQLLQL